MGGRGTIAAIQSARSDTIGIMDFACPRIADPAMKFESVSKMENAVNSKCFICLEPRSLTAEHIIPQALGGRLREKLYCARCNSDFGNSIDADLVKTFGFVATMLNIRRERGSNRAFEVEEVGSHLPLMFDGNKLRRKKPIIKVTKKDGKRIGVDVVAGSKKELDKIRRRWKAKYDLPGDGDSFQESHPGPAYTSYASSIDSVLIRRAVTKMAYGLLCNKVPASEVLSSAFDKVRAYIKGSRHLDMASANYIHTAWTCDDVRPLHKIHISNRAAHLVVGFVTIFGTFRFTVLLSNSYNSIVNWAALDYTYDPVAQNIVEGNPNFCAPAINEAQILRPRQSKDFVLRELNKAHRMLATYVDGYTFLDGEFEQTSKGKQ